MVSIHHSHAGTDEKQSAVPWPLVLATSLLALLMAIWPVAVWAAWIRPEFALLMVVYWVLVSPFRIGMLYAWSLGLGLDFLEGGMLCQHALGLTFAAYLTFLFHTRLHMYSLFQQMLAVFVIAVLFQLIDYWIYGLTGGGYSSLAMLLPAVSSAIFWPFMRLAIDRLR